MKKFLIAIVSLAMVFALAGCQSGAGGSSSLADVGAQSGALLTGNEMLSVEELQELSNADKVFATHKSVHVYATYFDVPTEDGGVSDVVTDEYITRENGEVVAFVSNNQGLNLRLSQNSALLYNAETEEVSVLGFADEKSQQRVMGVVTDPLFYTAAPDEVMVDQVAKDGTVLFTIEYSIATAERGQMWTDMWGFSEGTARMLITVEEATGDFMAIQEYYVSPEGEETLCYEANFLYDETTYEVPTFADEVLAVTETRLVHLVVNPGSAEEVTFDYTVPVGTEFVMYDSGVELFTDEAMSDPFTGFGEEAENEVTLYVLAPLAEQEASASAEGSSEVVSPGAASEESSSATASEADK